MSDMGVQPAAGAAPEAAGLTQLQRVTNTFAAPSKTFEDIKRGNRSWWLPLLLFVLVGSALWVSVTVKVGWPTVVENGLRVATKQAERLQQLPQEQQEMQLKVSAIVQEVLWALGPAWVLLFNVIAAGILLGTINFGFGGRAKFGEVLSVSWYAGLPGLIKLALGAIGLWVGVAPETFMPGNPAGTNIGYYFSPTEMPMMVWGLLVALDVTFIWTLVLLSKGLAKVAGTKESSGYIAVFGWWVLYTLVMTGVSAAFS
ncbi:MAG: YIP1 family protein [Terracidiphilus sp.]|jgi:hypothetical protein